MAPLVDFIFQFIEYAMLGGIATIALVFTLSTYHPLIESVQAYFKKVITVNLGENQESRIVSYACLIAFIYFMGVIMNTLSFSFSKTKHNRIILNSAIELKGENDNSLKNIWKMETENIDTCSKDCFCFVHFPTLSRIGYSLGLFKEVKALNCDSLAENAFLLNLDYQNDWKNKKDSSYKSVLGTLAQQIRLIRGARLPIIFIFFVALFKLVKTGILKRSFKKKIKSDNGTEIDLFSSDDEPHKDFCKKLGKWVSRDIGKELNEENKGSKDEKNRIQIEAVKSDQIKLKLLGATEASDKSNKEKVDNNFIEQKLNQVIWANRIFVVLGFLLIISLNRSYYYAEIEYHKVVYKYGENNKKGYDSAANSSYSLIPKIYMKNDASAE